MGWIEIIKVQTGGSETVEGCRDYLKALEQEHTGENGVDIRIYTHPVFSQQLMIRLKWHSGHPEMPFSHVSGTLIYELRQFGLVDHSIWVDGNGLR